MSALPDVVLLADSTHFAGRLFMPGLLARILMAEVVCLEVHVHYVEWSVFRLTAQNGGRVPKNTDRLTRNGTQSEIIHNCSKRRKEGL